MPPIPTERVTDHVYRILASPAFANAERMRRYLRFVVEHALSSPNEPLKEMTVGMAFYAEKGDFDPRTTSVVRVDASRLRTKLREYYSSDGAADPIVIDRPKESYTPTFREGTIRHAFTDRAESHIAEPSVVVLPLLNLSPDPQSYFSDGLSEEIIRALSGIRGIRVVARTSAFALKHRNADFREIGRSSFGLCVNVQRRSSQSLLPMAIRLQGRSCRRLPRNSTCKTHSDTQGASTESLTMDNSQWWLAKHQA